MAERRRRRKKRRASKPSSAGEKSYLVNHISQPWDKQCEDCRWIYLKFHRACPECGSKSWDLMGRVYDPDGQERESTPPYIPTQKQIHEQCEEIREGWDAERLSTQERFQHWQVPTSEMKPPE